MGIALGALHRLYGSESTKSEQYALSQYTKALRTVHDSIEKGHVSSAETLLLACVLFCAFERMSSHLDSAISHLNSGLKLLLPYASTLEPNPHGPSTTSLLNQILTYLDNDRFCLGAVSPLTVGHSPAFVPEVPKSFVSVSEAQDVLTMVLSPGHRQLLAPNLGGATENIIGAIQRVRRWGYSFDEWFALRPQHAADEDVASLLVLYMWRIVIKLVVDSDLKQGELVWDAMFPEFEKLVQCAEEFTGLTAQPAENDLGCLRNNSAHAASMSSEQSFTVHRGGTMTEGLLAGLLGNTAVHPPSFTREAHETPSGDERTEAAYSGLIRRARTLRLRKGSSSPSDQIPEFPVRIKPTFTLTRGILYPLYALLWRCRDPQLRRRGLHVLEVCNRREGLWQ